MNFESDNIDSEHLPEFDGFDLLPPVSKARGGFKCSVRERKSDRVFSLRALKIAASAELSRFRAESKLCSSFDHPGMSKVVSGCISRDATYAGIISEPATGKSISEHLLLHNQFSRHQISGIVLQLTEVLDYAHSKGGVHGFLASENILLLPDKAGNYRVKLTDFGFLSLFSCETGQPRIGIAFPVAASFMSPEVIEARSADERADIYSLACLLCELILGRTAFDPDEAHESLVLKKRSGDLRLISQELSRSQAGEDMIDLLESSLSGSPSLRPSNIKEFRRLFVRAMGGMQELSRRNLHEVALPLSGGMRQLFIFFMLTLLIVAVLLLLKPLLF